jgi:hypothetical protein
LCRVGKRGGSASPEDDGDLTAEGANIRRRSRIWLSGNALHKQNIFKKMQTIS